MTTKEVRNDGQMTGGIIEIDVHGKNTEEAKTAARGFGACSVRNTVTEGSRR